VFSRDRPCARAQGGMRRKAQRTPHCRRAANGAAEPARVEGHARLPESVFERKIRRRMGMSVVRALQGEALEPGAHTIDQRSVLRNTEAGLPRTRTRPRMARAGGWTHRLRSRAMPLPRGGQQSIARPSSRRVSGGRPGFSLASVATLLRAAAPKHAAWRARPGVRRGDAAGGARRQHAQRTLSNAGRVRECPSEESLQRRNRACSTGLASPGPPRFLSGPGHLRVHVGWVRGVDVGRDKQHRRAGRRRAEAKEPVERLRVRLRGDGLRVWVGTRWVDAEDKEDECCRGEEKGVGAVIERSPAEVAHLELQQLRVLRAGRAPVSRLSKARQDPGPDPNRDVARGGGGGYRGRPD
jgi:hypothetical protein